MKLNFRKIASVLSSAVMISSTVALAAAATYPAPFVTNGTANVGVVFGSSAGGQLDSPAAIDIASSLNSRVTTTGTGGTTTVTGESFTLAKTNNKFNLNEDLNDIYTTLDLEDLPTLLADGEYDADDETEYSQELVLGAGAMSHFQNDDFNDEAPIIGFQFADGDPILNYTLEFDSATAIESDSELVILGKTFYIAENSSTDNSITLLDASASQRINEGDTVTVEATNGQTYTVTLDFVEEGDTSEEDEANFVINDEAIDSMEAGDTEEVEEGVYIVVDKVSYVDSDTRPSYAQFSLGTGKLLIQDGAEVELNDDPLSSIDEYEDHMLTANISIVGGVFDSLTLVWEANGDVWLAPGTDLVLPGFGGVKLTMGEFTQSDYEETTLEGSSDAYYLKTAIAQGEVSVPLLHQSDAAAVDAIGADTDEELVTRAYSSNGGGAAGDWRYMGATSESSGDALTVQLNSSLDSIFVASWTNGDDEGDSYAFQLKKIDYDADTTDTEVVLDNLVTGESDVTFSEVGDDVSMGEITLELVDASEANGYARVNISSSSNVYLDRVITKEGLTAFLPVPVNTTNNANGCPYINLTNAANADAWEVNFTEEDEDGAIANGGRFSISMTTDASDGIFPSGISMVTDYETEDNSDKYIAFVESDVATKIELDKTSDVNTLSILYPGDESYAEVMVAESGASVTTGGSTGSIVPVYDTELDKVSGKNLVVVGGACVNTLAASLLGSSSPLCGAAWQSATNVGAGSFLIQTFDRGSGTVATLVAGYDLGDTLNAVKALKTDTTIDISAGKKYIGDVSSVQSVSVGAA